MSDRAFFLRYYSALSSGDYAVLESCYDPDLTLINGSEQIRGREALIARIAEARKILDNEVIADTVINDGDRTAVVYIDRFQAKVDIPEFMGRRLLRGDRFELQMCGVYRFENGRIKDVTMYSGPPRD
jgi:hypothetical protein